MARRDADAGGDVGVAEAAGGYVTSEPDGGVPDVVFRWERAVHDPGIYDLEVDTSTTSAEACAAAILRRVSEGAPGRSRPWPLRVATTVPPGHPRSCLNRCDGG